MPESTCGSCGAAPGLLGKLREEVELIDRLAVNEASVWDEEGEDGKKRHPGYREIRDRLQAIIASAATRAKHHEFEMYTREDLEAERKRTATALTKALSEGDVGKEHRERLKLIDAVLAPSEEDGVGEAAFTVDQLCEILLLEDVITAFARHRWERLGRSESFEEIGFVRHNELRKRAREDLSALAEILAAPQPVLSEQGGETFTREQLEPLIRAARGCLPEGDDLRELGFREVPGSRLGTLSAALDAIDKGKGSDDA